MTTVPAPRRGRARREVGTRHRCRQFQGERRAQVKGTIGEGERSATFFKAKPAPGKSRLSQDEVISQLPAPG